MTTRAPVAVIAATCRSAPDPPARWCLCRLTSKGKPRVRQEEREIGGSSAGSRPARQWAGPLVTAGKSRARRAYGFERTHCRATASRQRCDLRGSPLPAARRRGGRRRAREEGPHQGRRFWLAQVVGGGVGCSYVWLRLIGEAVGVRLRARCLLARCAGWVSRRVYVGSRGGARAEKCRRHRRRKRKRIIFHAGH